MRRSSVLGDLRIGPTLGGEPRDAHLRGGERVHSAGDGAARPSTGGQKLVAGPAQRR